MKKYLILLALVTIQSCSSGGGDDSANDTGANNTVNLAGTWDYVLSTSGTVCDGIFPQGTATIYTDGNNIETQSEYIGEQFDIDSFGTCSLVSWYEIDTDDAGESTIHTADSMAQDLQQDFAGDGTVKDVSLIAFTENNVVGSIEFTNGAIIQVQYTR